MNRGLLKRTFEMLERARRRHTCTDDFDHQWPIVPCCPKCPCGDGAGTGECTCTADANNAVLDDTIHEIRVAMLDQAIARCTLWAQDVTGGARSDVVDALVAHKAWMQFERQIKDLR